MAAQTHTRSHPPARGVVARLPWWALVLPVLAFAALLTLIAVPGDAHAAGDDPAAGDLLRQILRMLVR
ncbi:hypothetical protein HW130_09195 [Streptomyces sp. PKU-EA00015]|nr:hypothetical protein [Streptomyces sp. PKU-EA00015]NWF26445.1 hypothetical protein [Streptomyces sp. PKU-EA00015]